MEAAFSRSVVGETGMGISALETAVSE